MEKTSRPPSQRLVQPCPGGCWYYTKCLLCVDLRLPLNGTTVNMDCMMITHICAM